jgi:hypothetical protein
VAIGVALNNKGYVGTGNYASIWQSDFYEWDPLLNTWTQNADFGGGPRQGPAAFVLNDKVFVGTGDSGVNRKDLWSWDPLTNTWTQELDFGGAQRAYATGLTIGGRGYIGMGFFFTASANDLWEYCDTCQIVSALPQAELPEKLNAFLPRGSQQVNVYGQNTILPIQADLFALNGQRLLSYSIPAASAHPYLLHLEGQAPGVYLLRLRQGQQVATFKICYSEF